MLIVDGKLDLVKFKEWFNKLDWIRAPRILNKREDKFYVGTYEDDKMKIVAKVRPSMRMEVSETFKGKDISGRTPKVGYKGQTYEFGTTVEILINDKFMEELDKVANILQPQNKQKLDW